MQFYIHNLSILLLHNDNSHRLRTFNLSRLANTNQLKI